MARSISHRALTFAAAGVLFLLAAPPPAMAGDSLTEQETQLIKSKCTICHTEDRILNSDPGRLRATLDTMKQKSPAFFADVDDEALNAALVKMLNDPEVVARRKAWEALLAEGKALFSDATLGTTGKSCASCHNENSLRGITGDYPKFDKQLNRHVSLLDKINWMISSNMGGKILPLGDPKSVALEAYIKSLR